jgi:vacuolar-type H+-ATPase subunit C/Vma6
VFHADLDRRAVRALIRGAAQGAPVATRLEGLAPTPSLPLRALTDLAHDESAAAVVKHLVLLRYPDAVSLLPLARQVHPDLLAVDVVLLRAFARESCAAAARGDRYLRQYVAELIDICNLQIALLAAASHDVVPDAIFVNGGRWLSAQVLTAAVRAPSREMATSVLRSPIAHSPLASLPLATADPARLDRAFLADALGRYARFARLEPLSSAAVLVVLLRLEAQSRDLRAIAWGAALHTPPALRRQMLVTPS